MSMSCSKANCNSLAFRNCPACVVMPGTLAICTARPIIWDAVSITLPLFPSLPEFRGPWRLGHARWQSACDKFPVALSPLDSTCGPVLGKPVPHNVVRYVLGHLPDLSKRL